ncbi:MAG: hypothetical protein CMA03_04595 [Euryarchaeota archaeon]|nr:hypothetical protein [Euryarchaeota archaeon]
MIFISIVLILNLENEHYLETKSTHYSGNSNCVDAPNVATIEFQQSIVTLPSHETYLIQATLRDSGGSIIGIDPDWSTNFGSITPIVGLQQARFTPGELEHTTIWACAGNVNESLTVNVIQGKVEHLMISSSKENLTADESAVIVLEGEDIRGNIFTLTPPKQNWTYPEGSLLSISNEVIWDPKNTGWQNISVQESGFSAELSFNVTHGNPIRLSIVGDNILITSDESVEMQSVLVDADGNHLPVISNWSTYNVEASEWLTEFGDTAKFDGWTAGSWKILSEYIHPVSGQYFVAEYDILVSVGELNQILLDGHGMTLTVDDVLDLNPRAIDSAGNLIPNVDMIWTINGQISSGTLEESNYVFSTESIGLYEIQVSTEGGSASITCDFIHGEAVRIVVTETSNNQLTVKSGETIELLTEGEDQFGNRFAVNVNWSLTNGTGVMTPSSTGIGYYEFKPGDASGFVIMDFSTLGMSEQIVIDVQPGEITKLRIDYEGELKQGNTVRLLISAVDDSGNFVSYCNANSAIVTSEIGKVIREDSQLYMKFEGSGSSTIEVGCYGFKETFYLQIEETILWGIFEDTQKVIIYTSLILMIIITVLLVLMITRSKDEYEEYDDVQPLPLVPISTQPIVPIQHAMPPLPALPLPLPPIPQIPKIPAPQIPVQTPVQTQQNINPPQLQIQVESSEQKLGNAMNLLTNKESVSEDVETNKAKFEPLSDDDLSWD